jgi:glycosyltransferase involved in cell wall biosynthesis
VTPGRRTIDELGASRQLAIAVTYPFALGTRSGGSTSVFETVCALARQGAAVTVLPVSTAKWTSFPRPRLDPELLGAERRERLAALGVEVVPVRPDPLTQWRDGRRVARAVRALARRRRIDVLLGFHNEASGLPRLASALGARFGMIALWQSYRMALEEDPSRHGAAASLVRLLNRQVVVEPLRRAERVFASSAFTRDELVEVVGVDAERIRVSYLGIDPVFATLARPRPERIERLLFFGRLVPGKGVYDALEALAALAAAGGRSWSYRLMGDGEVETVAARARELGIADRIEILPFQDREALCREIEAAQLALMPSHSESFGLSIAEAQAAGLPVVAFCCGSVPEIVAHGVTGWLAPFRDVGALRRCLEEAIADPAATFRAGLAGRERVARKFTWPESARRILAGLRELGEAGENQTS